MRVQRWDDPHSGRKVWLLEAGGDGAAQAKRWPAKLPWTCEGFGLLVIADHVVDVTALAHDAVAAGAAFVSAWGPGCALLEDVFDEAIVSSGHPETRHDVVLTTSHAEESLGEALDFFLDDASPSRDRVAGCDAWCIFVVAQTGELGARVARTLERRGATRKT
jgi:hypothetical protein